MATADDYAAWIVKNADRKGTPEFDTVAQAYQHAKADSTTTTTSAPEATAQDRAQSFAAGVNRSALANLPGLPVDTALNVADLGKAAYGYVRGKMGAKPEDLPQLTDRASIPMSSEWIANKERAAGLGKTIDMNVPTDMPSRVLNAGGQGVGGSMLGNAKSIPAALQNAVAGGASQLLAQGTQEAGGNPASQVLASLAPGVGPSIRQRGDALPVKQPTARDAAIARAQAEGYVFPPSQVQQSGIGLINGALENLSGKAATYQAASVKNQNITQDFVKKDFGIPENAPLNIAALEDVRSKAGQAYEAVKRAGPVVADGGLASEMNTVLAPYDARVAQFPKSARNAKIDNLREDMQVPDGTSINPSVVIDQIKQLRSDGSANKGSRDPDTQALGKVQIGTAGALENLIDRNLAKTGNQDLLTAYRDARRTIAKSYTAQGAMDPVTGNIDAGKLAQALQRGKPITDGMRTVAETASVVPNSMKDIKTGAAGISKLDALTSVGSVLGSIAMHNPWLALGALAPIGASGARAGLLSGPYQRTMVKPNYGPGTLGNLSRLFGPDQAGLLGALDAPRR